MKSLNRAIERFCYKHPRFGIQRLMLYISVGSALVFILGMMDRTGTLYSLLAFDPYYIVRGQVWRIISWVFITEGSNFILEALVLYFYYFIGNALEGQWGTGKFTLFYLIGVILNIVFATVIYLFVGHASFGYISGYFTSYYINFSLFFAFATLFPEQRVMLFFFIPIKIKWLALLDAAFFVYYIVVLPFPINLLPVIAVINVIIFCGSYLKALFRPLAARANPSGVRFRQEVHRAENRQNTQPYRHKCAVCGRTDVTNPELEFRYCSRCEGYHCFCMDHINNHVHFQ